MVNSGSKWGRVVSEPLCVLTSFSFFLAGYFAIAVAIATSTLIRQITHAMTQTHSGNATPLTKLIEYSISKSTISFLSNCTVTWLPCNRTQLHTAITGPADRSHGAVALSLYVRPHIALLEW